MSMDLVTMGSLSMMMAMKVSDNVFNPNGNVVNGDDKENQCQ